MYTINKAPYEFEDAYMEISDFFTNGYFKVTNNYGYNDIDGMFIVYEETQVPNFESLSIGKYYAIDTGDYFNNQPFRAMIEFDIKEIDTENKILLLNSSEISMITEEGGESGALEYSFNNVGYTVSPSENFTGTELIIPESYDDGVNGELPVDTVTGFSDKNLELLELSKSLKRIERNAFINNKITSLQIPRNVTYIGSNAFNYNMIDSLYYDANTPTLSLNRFEYNVISKLYLTSLDENNEPLFYNVVGSFNTNGVTPVEVYVPDQLLDTYLSNSNWNNLVNQGQVAFVQDTPTREPFVFTYDSDLEGHVLTPGPDFDANMDQHNFPDMYNDIPVVKLSGFNNRGINELHFTPHLKIIDVDAFANNDLSTVRFTHNNNVFISSNAFANNNIETIELFSSSISIDNNAFENNPITMIDLNSNRFSEKLFININGNPFSNNTAGIIECRVPEELSSTYDAHTDWNNLVTNETVYFNVIADMNNKFTFTFDSENYGYICTGLDGALKDTHVAIPDEYDDGVNGLYNVIGIAQEAFKGVGIAGVYVPRWLQFIANEAFKDNDIEHIDIDQYSEELPPRQITLGDYAFANNKIKEASFINLNITFGIGVFANNNIYRVDFDNMGGVITPQLYINNEITQVSLDINNVESPHFISIASEDIGIDNPFAGNRSGNPIDVLVPESLLYAYRSDDNWSYLENNGIIQLQTLSPPKVKQFRLLGDVFTVLDDQGSQAAFRGFKLVRRETIEMFKNNPQDAAEGYLYISNEKESNGESSSSLIDHTGSIIYVDTQFGDPNAIGSLLNPLDNFSNALMLAQQINANKIKFTPRLNHTMGAINIDSNSYQGLKEIDFGDTIVDFNTLQNNNPMRILGGILQNYQTNMHIENNSKLEFINTRFANSVYIAGGAVEAPLIFKDCIFDGDVTSYAAKLGYVQFINCKFHSKTGNAFTSGNPSFGHNSWLFDRCEWTNENTIQLSPESEPGIPSSYVVFKDCINVGINKTGGVLILDGINIVRNLNISQDVSTSLNDFNYTYIGNGTKFRTFNQHVTATVNPVHIDNGNSKLYIGICDMSPDSIITNAEIIDISKPVEYTIPEE